VKAMTEKNHKMFSMKNLF